MSKFRTTIERERQILHADGAYNDVTDELQVEVHYRYYRGHRETWGYDGGSPAEPECCEIEKVIDLATKEEIDLTDKEEKHLESEAMDDVQAQGNRRRKIALRVRLRIDNFTKTTP